MGFSTDCIHAGQEPEPQTGAVTIPIYQTSTYVQPELGRHKGYEYARTQNPTRSALEANLAALERGKHGHCFASGMSATDTVFRLLKSGDHVVAGENMYGGSYRLFSRVLEKYGLQFTYVDTSNVDAVKQRAAAEHAHRLPGDADQSDDDRDRPRRLRGSRAQRAARWSSSTTRSARPTSSARSSSARTSSCTPRRSSSTDTPTRSAAW